MITESYHYIALKQQTRFVFESEGIQGKIIKIIEFSLLENGEWNLGFGDVKDGRIDDSVVSNNQDIVKVLQTVAKAIYEFLQTYPLSIIVINPVDEKRKRLYNTVFQRHFVDIESIFIITGIIKGEKEIYSPQKNYDNFQIRLKFES
jgi:hypothetical protein